MDLWSIYWKHLDICEQCYSRLVGGRCPLGNKLWSQTMEATFWYDFDVDMKGGPL